MNDDAVILSEKKIETPPSGNGEIFTCIRDIYHEYTAHDTEIDGLALSVPGAVDVGTGYVSYAGSVLDIIGVNMKEELADLGVQIELENDANCAALAEKWKGNATDCENFLCVTIGTGIGGAIFNRGEIIHGVAGMAGEFGLMMLDTNGSIEEILSERTFSRFSSTYNIVEQLNTHFNENKTGEEWFELYDAGNSVVVDLVHTFYDRLSIGIINLMHIFAPEKIVIGGGISSRPELVPYVKSRISKVTTAIAQSVEVEACKQKNQAGLIGALYHFQQMSGYKQ